jgi:hypothetical protein
MAPFQALKCYKQLGTHVFVGMGAASFWRGAWYVLDDHLFPEDAVKSAAASLLAGTVGMAASQGLVARAERLAKKPSMRRMPLAVARFGALYTVAVSCVLVWRGTWVGWDCIYDALHPDESAKSTDPGHATHSGLLSHGAAVAVLLATGLFASVLAPPAAVSVIRDFAVKASSTNYQGPAQVIASRLFGGTTSRALSTTTKLSAAAKKSNTTATTTTTRATTGGSYAAAQQRRTK